MILPILLSILLGCVIRLFFDMWDRRIVRSYDSDSDFNNLGVGCSGLLVLTVCRHGVVLGCGFEGLWELMV